MAEPEDPYRADAALVYRQLRDAAPVSALGIADAVFPWPVDGPASSLKAIRKRSLWRVYRSIEWMRGQGVAITCVPSSDGRSSTFVLGHVPVSVTAVPVTVRDAMEDAKTDAEEVMEIWGH